ncbi:proximal sequence element A Pbp45 [Augochlora pura]
MARSKWLILNGFEEDCEQLINRFEQAQDIRFHTFCEIWREMKFSLVFAGRPSYNELLEFCEGTLNICKKLLLLSPRFKERIGVLYLLYGVYYKMPTNLCKIRIKADDWSTIVQLHSEIKEAEHLDANYILCKLIMDNAFHFCIFDKEFGLEKYYRTKDCMYSHSHSVLPAIKDMIDSQQVLSKISELSKAYGEQKQTIISKIKLHDNLNLFNTNIAEEISNDIIEFEGARKIRQLQSIFNCGASTSKAGLKKRKYRRLRPLIDDGFETDSSESEDDLEIEECDSDISESE